VPAPLTQHGEGSAQPLPQQVTQGAPSHLLRSYARTASCWRPKRNSSHVKLLTWRSASRMDRRRSLGP
jgi:hypothetical protein